MARKRGPHYVSNKQFYLDIQDYYKRIEEAEKEGKEIEICPKVLDSIMKICHKLATSGNFNGYSYKEDMVWAAIEKCFVYHKNFNVNKSDNPFSYFTSVAYNVFRQILKKEKGQLYVKKRIVDEGDYANKLVATQSTDDKEYAVPGIEFLKQLDSTDFTSFITPKAAQKKAAEKEAAAAKEEAKETSKKE